MLEGPTNKKPEQGKEKPSIKEGVEFVFEQNPELATIGTKEQYGEYLETIFPESIMHEILYHNSNNKFDKFTRDFEYYQREKDKNRAFYFSSNKEFWKRQHTYPVVLNIENIAGSELKNNPDFVEVVEKLKMEGFNIGYETPITIDNVISEIERGSPYVFEIPEISKFCIENNISYTTPEGGLTYAVFHPEQIHILGSENDKDGFKQFVESKN